MDTKKHKSAYMSASELAAYLSVSFVTVRTMSDDGRLPRPIKLGKMLRWNREEVERHLAMSREEKSNDGV
jgi:excisionase family DNA binding protein